ncbi:MAG: hypothetical protein Q8Q67_00900 [bacterium]|nr:hypothetical protein [bacterium]
MNISIKTVSHYIIGSFAFFTLFVNDVLAAPTLKDAFKRDTNKPLQTVAEQGGGYLPGITVESLAGRIVTAIISLLGIIFVLFVIYGGFLYLTAAGNEEKTKKGRTIIVQSLLGLIIILSAYAISYFVINLVT